MKTHDFFVLYEQNKQRILIQKTVDISVNILTERMPYKESIIKCRQFGSGLTQSVSNAELQVERDLIFSWRKTYMDEKKILVVIPARGASKGIPRKNIRMMAGKPLIAYAISNAVNCRYHPHVIVSTDDEEIAWISEKFGAEIIRRPEKLAADNVTLDPVIFHAVGEAERRYGVTYDVVVTMQPTSPSLQKETLDAALDFYFSHPCDTVISVVNRPHLAWGGEKDHVVPLYRERLNRQLLPAHYQETGAFFISSRKSVKADSRFGNSILVFPVSEKECIDIDSPQDWWVAEKELSKKNIIIRTDGYTEIGMGHIYRSLLLGYNLIEHNVHYVLSKKSDLGIKKIANSFFPYQVIEDNDEILDVIREMSCDILINDILNTDGNYIRKCKSTGVRVVNFEDLGKGGKYADVVINDLYDKQNDLPNYRWGSQYYCIRDEFLLAKPTEFRDKVREILVLFGGTDPCNLTQKLFECVPELEKLEKDIHVTFILGIGYPYFNQLQEYARLHHYNVEIIQNVSHITRYMQKADIAVSSQGRTMFELASMAVPTILLAQNEREQDHEFGYLKNGFFNLGLGTKVTKKTIIETIRWLINCPQLRLQIRTQMLNMDLKHGLKRVLKIILDEEL